jgi:hypothetical protein
MPPAAVPKTTVNENSEALAAKHEIRATEHRLMATPACDTVCTQNVHESKLGALIAP